MATAILTDYDNLYINDGNTDFSIVTATPNPRGSTKIKRWWNPSYDKVTYVSCALIEILDSYIVVDCNKDARLKMVKGNDSLSFSVGFDEPGDGNINRILVCPKSELHALTNYDDYYYDYNTKELKHIQYGTGGIILAAANFAYTITIASNGDSFTVRSDGTVDYTVDWGDGNTETSTSNDLAHTYATSGTYVVKINSNSGLYRPQFYDSGDEAAITSIAIGTNDPAVIGTSMMHAFRGAVNLTQYTQPFTTTSNVTNFRAAWRSCSQLTSFPLIDTSSGTYFAGTWRDCSGLLTFPAINTSSATSFQITWSNCSALTSFPVIDSSNVSNLSSGWSGCSGLTSFPQINTSSATTFQYAWSGCSGLTSFPQINTSSATTFRSAWTNCTSLSTFEANQFDSTASLDSIAFEYTWDNCALTAQSVKNILTSLDTNGSSNITLSINNGTNANASTWSYDALTAYINLENKGWTIAKNGDATDISYKITIASDGDTFNLRSDGTVNYTVDWGDSNSETSTSNTLAHTYTTAGTYVIKVNSNSGIYRPKFNSSGDEDQITSVAIGTSDSAVLGTTNIKGAFKGADNMTQYTQVSSATSTIRSFEEAWYSCSSLTTFPVLDTSTVDKVTYAWRGCSSLTSFPLIDSSNITNFYGAWMGCSGLTSFPALNTSSATNLNSAWFRCSSLTSFPALDFTSVYTFFQSWVDCTLLTTFPANLFDTTGTLNSNAFTNTWKHCALTAQSIENILTSLDTNNQSGITLGFSSGTNAYASTWSYDALTAYINLHNKGWTISKNGNATDISYKITIASDGDTFNLRSLGTVNYTVDWGDSNSETSTSNTLAHTYTTAGTYVIKVNSNSGIYRQGFNNSGDEDQITSIAIGTDDSAVLGSNLGTAFYGANNLTEYIQRFAATSNVIKFQDTWQYCSGLTSFPLIDTSSGTNFIAAWGYCTGLTSFPLIDTSSGTNFFGTWGRCSGLTSFPLIDTSSGTEFSYSWQYCSGLTAFPALDFSSMTYAKEGWYSCNSLATFPANMFDTTGTLNSNAFGQSWRNCALTAQSIENILTSLDTNGASNITLGINGGTNASKTTWSTAANTAYNSLITKGWTISYNS